MTDRDDRTIGERLQEEVHEIAEVLLREHPPGTRMMAVWEEALSLHRVRFETQILSDSDDLPGG